MNLVVLQFRPSVATATSRPLVASKSRTPDSTPGAHFTSSTRRKSVGETTYAPQRCMKVCAGMDRQITKERHMTELTIDQLDAFTLELRQRDPRFLRVLSANVEEGQGEY